MKTSEKLIKARASLSDIFNWNVGELLAIKTRGEGYERQLSPCACALGALSIVEHTGRGVDEIETPISFEHGSFTSGHLDYSTLSRVVSGDAYNVTDGVEFLAKAVREFMDANPDDQFTVDMRKFEDARHDAAKVNGSTRVAINPYDYVWRFNDSVSNGKVFAESVTNEQMIEGHRRVLAMYDRAIEIAVEFEG